MCDRVIVLQYGLVVSISHSSSTIIGHSYLSLAPNLAYFMSRNFREFGQSLRREKFYIERFAKVYAREIFSFFLQTCWPPLIMR